MFKSVFAKYISAFMCIIFISFLVLVLIITGMVNSYAVNAKTDLLSDTARAATQFLHARASGRENFADMIENDRADIDRMFHALTATGEDVSVLLTDAEGRVVRMINEAGETGPGNGVIPREVMDKVNLNLSISEFEPLEGVFDTPHFYCALPVLSEQGDVCGAVFACSSSLAQQGLLKAMVKTIIAASLWVMLAALIAVYIITERVIGPLKDMSRMAKDFAAGNFNARVPVRGRDEVAELAVAFNNMADSLSRLEVMRNTFMANVSHDLRTPMTTISGFIDNILSGATPPERRDYYLGLIRTEVQRLARLVSSLLDISRIQAGDRKFDLKPFDVCEMARLILISFETKIEDKHLDVEFLCDADNMSVVADHDAIYQILYNICDNAVKFSREGGKLRVSLTATREHKVTVSVYNEGEGIAAADLPFVFERFYKGDKSRGLDKTGTGLGLFIAKTIIDAHHERIWVESEEGKFCEFHFTLAAEHHASLLP